MNNKADTKSEIDYFKTPLKRECTKCGDSFTRSTKLLLSVGSLCIKCLTETRGTVSHVKPGKSEKKFIKKNKQFRVIEWKGIHKKSKLQCSCGKIFLQKPSVLAKVKGSTCGFCADKSHKENAYLLTTYAKSIGAKYTAFTHKSKKEVKPIGYKYLGREHNWFPAVQINKDYLIECLVEDLGLRLPRIKAIAKTLNGKLRLLVIVTGSIKELPPNKKWMKWTADQIEEHVRKDQIEDLNILSMDPGTKNHAWSVLKCSVKSPEKIEVVASGMIQNTLLSLKGNMRSSTKAYANEIKTIVEAYGINAVIAERYMTRGLKGATIELVSAMIGGVLFQVCEEHNISKALVIPAAQWKNEFNKQVDLEQFYTKVKGVVVHQVDSVGIGIYGQALWMRKKPYAALKKQSASLAKQIQKTNLEKKTKI